MKKLAALLISLTFLLSPQIALADGPTLSLSPALGQFNRGCVTNISIDFDTAGVSTAGIDAIISFDPTVFTINSIQNGTVYQTYPGNVIDAQAGKVTINGLISIEQLASGQGVKGKGTLATLNMTVKPDAPLRTTQLTFEFDAARIGQTNDSNIAEQSDQARDVLQSVVNGNYTVGSGACGTTTTTKPIGGTLTTSPATGGYTTATPAALPKKNLVQAGDPTVTFVLTVVGSALTILGILGLALL
jgi:hypothetical protein